MIRKFIQNILIIILCCIFFNEKNYSQISSRAYNYISFGIHFINNLSNKSQQENWVAKNGFGMLIQTSFYLGYLQAGFDYLPYKKLQQNLPDYETMHYYLHWGIEFKLINNISLGIGTRVGIYEYDFEDVSEYISEGQLDEREIALGVLPFLSYEFVDEWKINISIEYLKIFTVKRIEQSNIYIGISKSFSSPQWLKDFMK